MAGFYDDAEATAADLLEELGGEGTLVRSASAPAYDPATGLAAGGETGGDPVFCAVFDLPYGFVEGSLVRQGDRKALVSARGVATAPKAGDVLLWAGDRLSVVTVRPLAPSGRPVLWTLIVRGRP